MKKAPFCPGTALIYTVLAVLCLVTTVGAAAPPTITTFTIPPYSNSRTVTGITLIATDDVRVTGYYLSESSSTPSVRARGWSYSAPRSYTFASSGAKTLYAWAKDYEGYLSSSRSARVTVDTTAPVVTSFSVPATSDGLTVSGISLAASDNVGVTGYLLSQGSTKPAANSSLWVSLPPASYTFTSAGVKTLYAWAKDAAGNVSSSRSAAVTVGLTVPDTTAPVVTSFTVPAVSMSLTVAGITVTASDAVGVTGYLLSESAAKPEANSSLWASARPTSYTFASAGVKTLYAWARDAAGNVSDSLSATVTIDTSAPVVTSFSVPATANSLTVSGISLAAGDNVGVTGYLLSQSSTKPAANSSSWVSVPPVSYTFTSAGVNTLYAWARDAAGNVSDSLSATVTIDTTAPVVTSFSVPATANSLTVSGISLAASDNVGVTGYLLSQSSTKPAASSGLWVSVPPTSYTFASAGVKTLYAWAKDAAGNVSNSRSAAVTVALTVPDTTAPVVTSFTVPAVSKSLTVSGIAVTASDAVGVSGYLLSESAAKPEASSSLWAFARPTSYTFASAGVKTLYAWARDAAGNVSDSLSATVTIDTSAPVVTAFSVPAAAAWLSVSGISLAASDDVGVTGYLVSESSTKPAATSSSWVSTPPMSYTFTSAGVKTLHAWAKDAAGNVSDSLSATVTIDTTAPVVTSFSMPATANSLTVSGITLAASDNVGVTGYLLSESPTQPALDSSLWVSTPPASFTFTSAGVKTLYAGAKDAAGNVSGSRRAVVTITILTATADPQASPKTKALLTYLADLPNRPDNRVLSGQHTLMGDNLIENIHAATGKYVGLVGVDYAYENNSAANNQVISRSNAGHLITICNHWNNPATGGSARDTTEVDFTELITPGSTLNTRFNGYLDAVAAGLQMLQDNYVTVLYRPFHDMNGTWFWWGGKGATQLKNAWVYVFNYLTTTKGLHNILWVYSTDAAIDTAYYPGSQYVDVVGVDLYGAVIPEVPGYSEFQSLNKPLALTEWGPCDRGGCASPVDVSWMAASIKTAMPKTVYWMNWAESFSLFSNTGTAALLADPWVITREEVLTIDVTPPTVTAFTLPPTWPLLSVPVTAFSVTDDVWVTGFCVTETAGHDSCSWSGTPPLSHEFSAPGDRVLYAYAKDAAGNVSAPLSCAVTVTGSSVGNPIDGVCGAAAGGSFRALSSGSPYLCSSGTVISFAGTGPWTWACTGSNGGTSTPDAACSASLLAAIPAWSYLDNGMVKIGVYGTYGAGIAYFSQSSPVRNLLNYYDTGREVQQSYYGNPNGSTFMTYPCRWNPVQSGDAAGNPSTVLSLTNDGTTIYAFVIPKDWHPFDVIPAGGVNIAGFMEEWITLEGPLAKIHFRFTYTGSVIEGDSDTDQEHPAMFTDYGLRNLVSYTGSFPWTNGAYYRVLPPDLNVSGQDPMYFTSTEDWSAYVDDMDWGIGVYTPGVGYRTAYLFSGGGATGGPTSASTSYMAPVAKHQFVPGDVYEYDMYLTIGSLNDIRSRFYDLNARIDITPPATTAVPPAGTYPGPQAVTLTCSDNVGCARIYYCMGGSCTPSILYNGPISIESTDTLRYYSIDINGNMETGNNGIYVINQMDPALPMVTGD